MSSLRPLLVVGLLLLAAAPARGQQPTSRLSVGLGVASAPVWMDLATDVLRTAVTLGSYRTENRSGVGAVAAQYERFLNERFALIGAAGFERISRDVIVEGDPRGTLSSTWGHVMGGAALHYLRGGTLGLYSSAAVGIALNHESADVEGSPSATESEVLPAFQITLLGMRTGRRFGPFLEIGAGYRGTVVLGASYDF